MQTSITPLTHSWQSLDQLLNGNLLQRIILKAHLLAKIEQQLLYLAENGLGEHMHVADLNDGRLVIQADSAAWGMQLRFQQASLLTQLQLCFPQHTISEIRVKIRPRDPIATREYWKKPSLSAVSAEVIASTATYINDEKLKRSLLRLAACAGKKSEAC